MEIRKVASPSPTPSPSPSLYSSLSLSPFLPPFLPLSLFTLVSAPRKVKFRASRGPADEISSSHEYTG